MRLSTSQTTNVDNIVNRVPEGFYQYSAATKSLGWPEDSGSWAHLLSTTHTNQDNYYALQLSGGFFDNDHFFVRKTVGEGNREWRELYHSGNLPALAFDDAAKLRQLGWTGDTNQQKLSSRYGSLAAAQAVFPSAQSLDEYIDGCAIERVIQLNQIFYNRSSINIPPGGSKVSRAIVTTGIEVSIRGAGRGATQLILVNENSTLFQHGPGDAQYIEGVSQNCQFQIENIFLSAETGSATNTNTRALDISYNATTGWFFQTHIKNVDFRGFSNPIRVINPCRGLQMDTVGIYSLDKMSFQAPAIEIVTTERSRDHSAQGMFKSVRTSGYRWGWDVRMVLSSGATGEDRDNTRRSMEGFIFLDCGSYNGWGMIKVVNEEPRYSSLLWEFICCDWQGAGNAVDMTRCNQIIVRGGFWIANHDAPSFDQADPTGSSYRRYFKFRGCDNVLLDRLRLDVDGKMPPHCLIEVDVDCFDVLIKDCVVRDYAGNAVAGFSIAGNGHNTVQEIGTVWQVWASREDLKVVDVFANQVSQTRARIYGGVDHTGEYSFRGKLPVTFNANGDVTVPLPRRPPVPSANGGNETPFFLTEPVVLVTPLSELIPLRVSATSQWEFVVSGGAAAASKQVWVAWTASGR